MNLRSISSAQPRTCTCAAADVSSPLTRQAFASAMTCAAPDSGSDEGGEGADDEDERDEEEEDEEEEVGARRRKGDGSGGGDMIGAYSKEDTENFMRRCNLPATHLHVICI